MEISAVIPVYNEKDNILPMVERIEAAFQKGFKKYEIIFVNDGSNDGSYEILNTLKMKKPNVKVYHFIKNSGQSAAIDAGFQKAEGNLVLMMDGDLQTDPEDVYKLLEYIPEYDVVNGRRATREDGFKRKLAS
ncbi:MAG: glycosyltransferase, partial [Cetobacterium sp.]|uniref:glycosyltransferase n=1 Tax=Cetobacterium sp. TaxID=2071632 RepID=UPI003F349A80